MTDKELYDIINEAAASGKTSLDLRNKNLTSIPASIGQLSNLTSLSLDLNQLTSIPESIGKLSNLTSLLLNDNQLTSIPESIGKLSNLTSLSLNDNQLTSIPESIGQLSNLAVLTLYRNKLTSIPESIGQLSKLTELRLSQNQLTSIPESIGQLTNLTSLTLYLNQLTSIPESIGNLKKLKQFYIYNNFIGEWSFDIKKLKVLDQFSVDVKLLDSIIQDLQTISSLRVLSLRNQQLTSIPKLIGKLSNINELRLDNNKLTSIPESIGKLSNLTQLFLQNNQLSSIPEPIGKLSNLTTLYLQFNQLTSIPESIGKLSNLTTLYLHYNQLTSIPESIGKLSNLTSLHLSDNKLSSIPESLGQLNKLVRISLTNNLFEIGKEAFKLPPKEQIREILKWQKAKQDNKLRPIHEAKVIFIGESNYGKTHLIEYLRKGKIQRQIKTTHGIERQQLSIPFKEDQIRLNIWDLGGQEFMRSTHQFFFSERTLYVLVTLARKERSELNHWLKLASQLGNNAPILVVINKIDLDPHDIDRSSLQRDYPNIIGFVRTCIKDCKEGGDKAIDTIKNLKNKITSIVTNEKLMPSIFEKRRPEWFTVKEELEKLGESGKDFITYQEYEELEHIKTLDEDERKSNLKLLSMLGSVVSYADDPRLMDTNVINPQWIMDGVYAVINDPVIKDKNKGKFNIRELGRLLDKKRFPSIRHVFLLDLMHKFNLCYQARGLKNIYFIPDLFEDIEPVFTWDSESAMQFRYDYDDFSPDAFMTRFIVEMHEDIKDKSRWRSGVLLSNDRCQAKVYQAFRKNYIHVEILGSAVERRRYLYSIRETFRRLHKPFPNMNIKEEVFYKKYWIDYHKLLNREKKNKPFYHDELDEDLPIVEILNGYTETIDRAKDRFRIDDVDILPGVEYGNRSTKETLRAASNYIQKGDLSTAIGLLILKANKPARKNELSSLSARMSQLSNDDRSGKLKRDDLIVERNQLTASLLDIIGDWEKEKNA
ncbi:MAG: COR domain-containing protein [Bacteroidota bacterium]